MKPIRVQRKRTKGYKLPENTVCVTRPGKYGNPFIIVGDMIYLNVKFRRKTLYPGRFWQMGNQQDCVNLFRHLLTGAFNNTHDSDIAYWVNHFANIDKDELRGKNLACWCALDKPCHADVLLEMLSI